LIFHTPRVAPAVSPADGPEGGCGYLELFSRRRLSLITFPAVRCIFTQRRSVQRRLFACLFVCVCLLTR